MVERMVEAHGVGGSSPSFPIAVKKIKGEKNDKNYVITVAV